MVPTGIRFSKPSWVSPGGVHLGDYARAPAGEGETEALCAELHLQAGEGAGLSAGPAAGVSSVVEFFKYFRPPQEGSWKFHPRIYAAGLGVAARWEKVHSSPRSTPSYLPSCSVRRRLGL